MEENKKIEKITVNINELCEMLSCGKTTARRIGKDAGARICVGRRVLYSVDKIRNYVEKVSK